MRHPRRRGGAEARRLEGQKASTYILPFKEFRQLRRRAEKAQKIGHFEVVGLLTTARRSRTLKLVFLTNATTEPGRWELRWEDLAAERRLLRSRGLRIIGLFHSHPLAAATLGSRDRRSTPTGWAHLVYDVCGMEPRLYKVRKRKGRRQLVEVPLNVRRSG
jgi:proteasome lid subunit RPN8/RPN11